MIRSPSFWVQEKDAPLLLLNRNFLQGGAEEILERVAGWPTLAGIELMDGERIEIPEVENPDRILIADAERTFRNKTNQKKFIKMLGYLQCSFKDYAQGLGYVSSFLLLTMEERDAFSLLSHLNENEKYIPGYWKHEAIVFATDAYVFRELLRKFLPDIANHLEKNTIDPATYCQKWFVGLCVHVLPFEHLFLFFEKFLIGGYQFLMKFGLSLMKQLKDRILSLNNPADLFAVLRLDSRLVIHDSDMLHSILGGADDFDFSQLDFSPLRSSTYDKYLRQRVESAHALLKSNHNDDIIADCEICEDDFPDFYCKQCHLEICENCHKKPPSDSTHKKNHPVKPVNDDDENERSGDEDGEEVKSSNEKESLQGKIDEEGIKKEGKQVGGEEGDDDANQLASDISKLKV